LTSEFDRRQLNRHISNFLAVKHTLCLCLSLTQCLMLSRSFFCFDIFLRSAKHLCK
jgi:hypothetical protein